MNRQPGNFQFISLDREDKHTDLSIKYLKLNNGPGVITLVS